MKLEIIEIKTKSGKRTNESHIGAFDNRSRRIDLFQCTWKKLRLTNNLHCVTSFTGKLHHSLYWLVFPRSCDLNSVMRRSSSHLFTWNSHSSAFSFVVFYEGVEAVSCMRTSSLLSSSASVRLACRGEQKQKSGVRVIWEQSSWIYKKVFVTRNLSKKGKMLSLEKSFGFQFCLWPACLVFKKGPGKGKRFGKHVKTIQINLYRRCVRKLVSKVRRLQSLGLRLLCSLCSALDLPR